jgi:hypothetical protein
MIPIAVVLASSASGDLKAQPVCSKKKAALRLAAQKSKRAQYVCLLSLQKGSIDYTKRDLTVLY